MNTLEYFKMYMWEISAAIADIEDDDGGGDEDDDDEMDAEQVWDYTISDVLVKNSSLLNMITVFP